MALKAFESGVFSKLTKTEQSEQSSDNVKYNSFGYDTHKLKKKLKVVSSENVSSDLNNTDDTDKKLFTPIKREQDLKY